MAIRIVSTKRRDRFTVEPEAPHVQPLLGSAGTSLSTVESGAGRPVGMHRIYSPNNPDAAAVTALINQAASDLAAGRLPWLSFKLTVSWALAKTGSADAWAADICARLGALDGPVMLTFHHEPEGDESPISDFVLMHNRLYQFSIPYENIRCGPCMIGYNEIQGPIQNPGAFGQYAFATLWPGSFDCGDFIGFDPYCAYLTAKGGSWLFLGSSYFTPMANFAASKGIGWAIGEYGLGNDGADYDRSLHTDLTWMDEAWNAANSLSASTAPCYGICYFDSGLNSTTNLSDGLAAWPLGTDTSETGGRTKLANYIQQLATSPLAPSSWAEMGVS